LSVVVAGADGRRRLITKGAFDSVLAVSDRVKLAGTTQPLDRQRRAELEQRFAGWSRQRYRVLGVAERDIDPSGSYNRADEQGLAFLGFLLFFDPPKPDAQQAIVNLAQLGV